MPNDFDKAAKNYDATFTYSSIGKAQRERVHHYLKQEIKSKKKLSILELNCGTGEDAIFLTNQGHKVIATDISSEMITEATSKNDSITFLQQDITTITSETFTETFDLIFSNFGGLNCLSKEQLETFIDVSETLLKNNGKLVFVIMPKHCLWEQFYFFIKGDFKKMNRRKSKQEVVANVDDVNVPTWYFNPSELKTLTKNKFTLSLLKPIGISIPPSYLEPFFISKKRFLKLLISFEKWLSSTFWSKFADHYIISFQKK
ncbi:MAG: class I SAM-dependent methyltransferase [Flavobacteriaceae bacterium]|nr:class I SAM-dependent methyltransferase [Flavobacteriaceae bacterium]